MDVGLVAEICSTWKFIDRGSDADERGEITWKACGRPARANPGQRSRYSREAAPSRLCPFLRVPSVPGEKGIPPRERSRFSAGCRADGLPSSAFHHQRIFRQV